MLLAVLILVLAYIAFIARRLNDNFCAWAKRDLASKQIKAR